MHPSAHRLPQSAICVCLIVLMTFNFDATAVDETMPHPIDERGLLSRVALKTTQLFRKVEIIPLHNSAFQKPEITIQPGTVIVIENQDNANHHLTFPSAPTP